MRKLFKLAIIIPFFVVLGASFSVPILATGDDTFSGSNCQNYQCPAVSGSSVNNSVDSGSCPPGVTVAANGQILCNYIDEDNEAYTRPAIPTPPQFRVVEYWFVRVLYGVWALAGIFFTFVLIWIGFMYMTSFGNEIALGEVVKRFRYWMIGIALVFLSYPALRTFFNVLSINQDGGSCYANLELPGFQIFFPDACGTEESIVVSTLVASCSSVCRSQSGVFAAIDPSINDPEAFCSNVCSGWINTCAERPENQDPNTGTPVFDNVRVCYLDAMCRATNNRPSECRNR